MYFDFCYRLTVTIARHHPSLPPGPSPTLPTSFPPYPPGPSPEIYLRPLATYLPGTLAEIPLVANTAFPNTRPKEHRFHSPARCSAPRRAFPLAHFHHIFQINSETSKGRAHRGEEQQTGERNQ